MALSQLENLSSKCANLHAVAASNSRGHPTRFLYYCLFAPHTCGCYSSHTWWIAYSMQCQLRGCNNISFSQETTPLACSFYEGCTWHDPCILVTAPFCCEARVACTQTFTLWQQATIEIMRRNHSVVACLHHLYTGVVVYAHSVRGEPRIQCNANWTLLLYQYG